MKVLKFDEAIQKDGAAVKVRTFRGLGSDSARGVFVSVIVCVLAHQFRCMSTLEGPKSEELSWVWPTHSPGTWHMLTPPTPTAGVTHAPPLSESGLWCFADDTGDIWMYDLKGRLAECTPPVAVSGTAHTPAPACHMLYSSCAACEGGRAWSEPGCPHPALVGCCLRQQHHPNMAAAESRGEQLGEAHRRAIQHRYNVLLL